MKPAVVITPHVINTLNALPPEERAAITSALAADLLLGEKIVDATLTPMQKIIYTMIRSYVRRDTVRFSNLSSLNGTRPDDPFCRRPSPAPLTAGAV